MRTMFDGVTVTLRDYWTGATLFCRYGKVRCDGQRINEEVNCGKGAQLVVELRPGGLFALCSEHEAELNRALVRAR